MSREESERFLASAAHSSKLRSQFESVQTPEEFIQKVHELNYDFSTEELVALVAELSAGVLQRRKTGVWDWLRTVPWRP